MLISLILGLLLGAVSVVFALQNTFPVTVTFLGWELTASLALLIVLAMAAGAVIIALISIPGAIKNAFTISRLKKDIKKLIEEVEVARRPSSTVSVPTGPDPLVIKKEI